jgi:hypothetical protein
LNDLSASFSTDSGSFILEDTDFFHQVAQVVILGKSSHHAFELLSHLAILLHQKFICFPQFNIL